MTPSGGRAAHLNGAARLRRGAQSRSSPPPTSTGRTSALVPPAFAELRHYTPPPCSFRRAATPGCVAAVILPLPVARQTQRSLPPEQKQPSAVHRTTT